MRHGTTALVLAWIALCACRGAADRDGAHHPAPQAARDGGELARDLDRLEERLLADQSLVSFWAEMRERHESVSAIAIVNQQRHADGMALLDDRQREKRHAAAVKNRVAVHLEAAPEASRLSAQ